MRPTMRRSWLAAAGAGAALIALAQGVPERFRTMSRQAEVKGLAEPFKGVTTHGAVEGGLFSLRSTGVSTEPVRNAAIVLLGALSEEQRKRTAFGVEDDEWRKWMNQHFYVRQGVSFEEMTEAQREAALGLLRASLSAKGLKLSRDIMKLNHTLGELNNDNFAEYGEWLYWITIMGEPSETQPWGWQLDGHHLIINYFVLGDQIVMTPLFVGSEPAIAESGKHQGVAILQVEQREGLRMFNALTPEQRKTALLQASKTGDNNLAEAFKDNLVLDYAGIAANQLDTTQKKQLLDLVGLYVDNMKEGHARVRMQEVAAHLDRTHFAWIGGAAEDAVFYYRIHSPVILIEFDHQSPANLRHLMKPGVPGRQHIHAVVRTPNGGDYGKDLLRRHYERRAH